MPSVRRNRSSTTVHPRRTTDTNKPSRNTTTRTGGRNDLFVGAAGATKLPALTKLIDSAQKRVYVRLPDFSDPGVVKSLEQAVARGVDVHVIVDAPPKSNESLLLGQGIEAQGVDVLVGGGDGITSWATVADDQFYAGGAPLKDGSAKSNPDSANALAGNFDKLLNDIPNVPPRHSLPAGSVVVHPMPQSGSTPVIQAINSATKSVDLEVFQLTDRGVIDALEKAAARGVKVRVMLEPHSVEPDSYRAMAKRLSAAGIQVQATPPQFDAHNNVDHAKFMVIDQSELLFGTGNLVRSGLGGNPEATANNRDFWTEDARADSIADGKKLFEADWNRQATNAAEFKNLIVTPDNSEAKLFSMIDGARKRVYVWNQELNNPAMLQHLTDAAKRGVDVQVLLGVQKFGHGPAKNQPAIDQLIAAGAKASLYDKNYLHAKGVIADGQAFLGSQNFSAGGLEKNREVGEIFNDQTTVDVLARQFASDFAKPHP